MLLLLPRLTTYLFHGHDHHDQPWRKQFHIHIA